MSVRKSPTASATTFPIGTRKRGNDGRVWIVDQTRAGIRRWVPVPVAARAAPAAARAAPAAKTHHILFCEPYTYHGRVGIGGGVRFEVSDRLYPALLRAPKKYRRHRAGAVGNAYVFGKRFPAETYAKLGDHGNDGAQTGFIDLDLYDPGAQEDITETVLRAFTRSHTEFRRAADRPFAKSPPKLVNWDHRPALRRLRAVVPHVLFLGETAGGDVGAGLYAHKTNGRIDSLIVDNNYFF